MQNPRTFVDPMVHSDRPAAVQSAAFGGILLLLFIGLWVYWWISGAEVETARLSMMLSGIVVAAFGIGYYMLKRNRGVVIDRVKLVIDDSGIKSENISGIVEFAWPEIDEVRISIRPSRNRMPDVIVRTRRGSLGVFMRWVDKDMPMPEPRLRAPGVKFVRPGGEEYVLTPENSELVKAIKEHLSPEKIKEGVIV